MHVAGASREAAALPSGVKMLAGGAPLERLLRSAAAGGRAGDAPPTFVFGPNDRRDAVRAALAAASREARIVVIGWIGTHPDARAPVLRELWEIEELCRAHAPATLALRLGPLLAPEAPLCARLARVDAPRYAARVPMHPVAERDVAETLRRALAGEIAWSGWHELGGPEPWTLEELTAALHESRGGVVAGRTAGLAGEWEPGLDALVEQRLIEPELWTDWSGVTPRNPVEEIVSWHA